MEGSGLNKQDVDGRSAMTRRGKSISAVVPDFMPGGRSQGEKTQNK
jgi:hypothetical protein